jgi:hypothetical protein
MDEHLISEEEAAQIMADEVEKGMAERAKEIKELGEPEWAVMVFQRLRRLTDTLRSERPRMKYAEIADEIDKILRPCPESLFAYDEKCKKELEAAALELKRLLDEEGNR